MISATSPYQFTNKTKNEITNKSFFIRIFVQIRNLVRIATFPVAIKKPDGRRQAETTSRQWPAAQVEL